MIYHDSCCALIKQINDSLEKYANNRLREDDLTLMQIAVLVELDNSAEKVLPLKALEKKFSVAQPTMLGIVRRLEQKGFVTTSLNPEDKRMKLVSLTEAGHGKCAFGYSYMEDTEQNLLQALDDTEQEEFRRLLKKVQTALP